MGKFVRSLGRLAISGLWVVASSCSHHGGGFDDTPLAPLSGSVAATDQVTLVPIKPRSTVPDPRKPTDPINLQALLADGFGDFKPGPPDVPIERTLDGATAPVPGKNRKRVARIVHISDFQLADDEAPTRLAAFDGPPPVEGAFRPQEAYGCRVLTAIVRTINRIHEDAPLDLVLLGGDNVDNAQNNELDWIFGILDGSPSIECDSGKDDDPTPGPGNDPKDPFASEGLAMPWYWVTGNHDVLAQGNIVVNDAKVEESIGEECAGGARNYDEPGAPVTHGTVIADTRRRMMKRQDMVSRVSQDIGRAGPRGHGLGTYAASSLRAFYTKDLESSPVRFLVLDTSAESGGADGVLHQKDIDAFVKPELDRAKAEGRWVVLASHHATDKLFDGNTFGGTLQADAVTSDQWTAFVTSYPNVILDLVGHAHIHRIQPLGKRGSSSFGGHAFWEVQTGAVADYQNQFRLLEIWDEDNGFLSIRATGVDYSTENDEVAAMGRKLAVLDWTTGWGCCGQGQPSDRNVILWEAKPQL